ncbi:MAG: GNAT family N-acetyltransferase [Roseburia sp.]|nr:GNAT family N-acetyltransferase [Roseburia sp.]MCM1557903.1 GNAT family N-acetyltransferase [Anaeroplasma bactoclasticum]
MKSIVSKEEYLNNPCGTLSIPYYKAKVIPIPDSIVILHEDDFHHQLKDYQRYFRLIHPLKEVKPVKDGLETLCISEDLLQLLNVCFEKENIEISLEDLYGMESHSTFHQNLWVGIRVEGKLIACGIAEFDKECREGSIEWICVLPEYQRRGYGSNLIVGLLHKFKELGADFVTVSGRVDNASSPEKFYRFCGFTGSDIWYICTKEG